MRKTGGDPPPKEPTVVQERIIKIFEDNPLLTGVHGFETGTKMHFYVWAQVWTSLHTIMAYIS